MKLDTKGLSDRTGIPAKTYENWRSLKKGPPYYKVGARVLYDDAEVDAWFAAHRRPGTSDTGGKAA
jgi:hypothetical protein